MKKCARCQQEFPATTGYFHKNGKYLKSYCKACACKRVNTYYKENKDARNKYMKQWYKDNTDKHRATMYKYFFETHPGILKIYEHKRKARIAENEFNYTLKDWVDALAYFEHKCAYCGDNSDLTKDHIIPTLEGGGFVPENIIPACKSCNSSKRASDILEWYPKQDFFSEILLRKIGRFVEIKKTS